MPTRYLKPGIRDSESIDRLSPVAECLYYRLLVTVDDFGRYDARASMVRSACFPVKESMSTPKCEALLAELSACGLVSIYTVDGKPYLQVQKWDNAPRAKESKYPPQPDICMQMHTDACKPPAVLPLTGTETGTETGTASASAQRPAKPAATPPRPDDVDEQTWSDWLALRKAKKAPVTSTVVDAAKREAEKAGMALDAFLQVWCMRGSQGLQADWIKPAELATAPRTFAQVAADVARTTVPSRPGKDPSLEAAEADRAACKPMPEAVRARIASILPNVKVTHA
jgi:hypothetical protein